MTSRLVLSPGRPPGRAGVIYLFRGRDYAERASRPRPLVRRSPKRISTDYAAVGCADMRSRPAVCGTSRPAVCGGRLGRPHRWCERPDRPVSRTSRLPAAPRRCSPRHDHAGAGADAATPPTNPPLFVATTYLRKKARCPTAPLLTDTFGSRGVADCRPSSARRYGRQHRAGLRGGRHRRPRLPDRRLRRSGWAGPRSTPTSSTIPTAPAPSPCVIAVPRRRRFHARSCAICSTRRCRRSMSQRALADQTSTTKRREPATVIRPARLPAAAES